MRGRFPWSNGGVDPTVGDEGREEGGPRAMTVGETKTNGVSLWSIRGRGENRWRFSAGQ